MSGIILADNNTWLVERCDRAPGHVPSLLKTMYVERGTKEDWDLLRELHYKAENLGIGPRVYRCVMDGQVIGVGVMTVPKMLLKGRNMVFRNMRPNIDGRDTQLVNRHRAMWLNARTCTNSRLVLDTVYRGAGIAYRMQNLMMRMTGCRFVEFQSSMSKLNPFAERAGMRFSKPTRSSFYVKGLKFFSRWFVSNPSDFVGLSDELNAYSPETQAVIVSEMRKFYYSCSAMEKSGDNRANGTRRVDAMSVSYLIRSTQQLVLASPLYGVFVNPDFDVRTDQPSPHMPLRLPLLSFDNQGVSEPLNFKLARQQMGLIKAKTQLIDPDWSDEEEQNATDHETD